MSTLNEYLSVFIAFLALGFTAWQAMIQRKHNKLSVTPHLINHTARSKHNDQVTLSVALQNNGLGPACITKFQVYLDGEPCEQEIAFKSALGELYSNSHFVSLGDTYVMPQNESVVLLEVVFKTNSSNQIEIIEERITNRLGLLIHYESIYGDSFVLDLRKK